eukprot:Colp12_sorted_trinity150504_noHs@3100
MLASQLTRVVPRLAHSVARLQVTTARIVREASPYVQARYLSELRKPRSKFDFINQKQTLTEFTPEYELLLEEAVGKHGDNWILVAQYLEDQLGGRFSSDLCARHYNERILPKISKQLDYLPCVDRERLAKLVDEMAIEYAEKVRRLRSEDRSLFKAAQSDEGLQGVMSFEDVLNSDAHKDEKKEDATPSEQKKKMYAKIDWIQIAERMQKDDENPEWEKRMREECDEIVPRSAYTPEFCKIFWEKHVYVRPGWKDDDEEKLYNIVQYFNRKLGVPITKMKWDWVAEKMETHAAHDCKEHYARIGRRNASFRKTEDNSTLQLALSYLKNANPKLVFEESRRLLKNVKPGLYENGVGNVLKNADGEAVEWNEDEKVDTRQETLAAKCGKFQVKDYQVVLKGVHHIQVPEGRLIRVRPAQKGSSVEAVFLVDEDVYENKLQPPMRLTLGGVVADGVDRLTNEKHYTIQVKEARSRAGAPVRTLQNIVFGDLLKAKVGERQEIVEKRVEPKNGNLFDLRLENWIGQEEAEEDE